MKPNQLKWDMNDPTTDPMTYLLDAANRKQMIQVDASTLVKYLTKAKEIADKATNIGGDQAARLNYLMEDVVNSIPQMFRVMADPPDYLVGIGPDHEFTVTARTLSKERAKQIANLLNG